MMIMGSKPWGKYESMIMSSTKKISSEQLKKQKTDIEFHLLIISKFLTNFVSFVDNFLLDSKLILQEMNFPCVIWEIDHYDIH